jgi:hypothetical protein
MYDPVLSTFTSMDVKRLTLAAAQEPPNNCPACLLNEQRDHEKETHELKDEHGNKHGVAFAGVNYHLEDFVLYRAEDGPANIGYVTKIQVANDSITVRKIGRISSLDNVLPSHIVRDEVGFFFYRCCPFWLLSYCIAPSLSDRRESDCSYPRPDQGDLRTLSTIFPTPVCNARRLESAFI